LRFGIDSRYGSAVEPLVQQGEKWLRRHALFDDYCDLVLRGLCSLEEALDSYLWELGYGVTERRQLVAAQTSPHGDAETHKSPAGPNSRDA